MINNTAIKIDPEFQAQIFPLSPEERKLLEENLVGHGGSRDKLVVWDDAGTLTLLDGHNRYEICTRLGLPFEIHVLQFESREDAAVWIDRNQLGRRNLTPDAFRFTLGRLYNRTKKDSRKGTPNVGAQNELLLKTADVLATQYGVSRETVKRAGKFAAEVEKTPELKQAIKEGKPVTKVKRELKERKREARRQQNRQKIASVPEPQKVVDAKYATIVIDPPWDWGDEGDCDQMGRAKPDYHTMSIEQLEKLDVASLADVDCHLYMWITNRSMPKGFRLLEAWGFRYVTMLTWVKPSYGMGNYFRGQTEHVLFGVKGSQPLKRKDVGTVFNAPRSKAGHSSKPTEFYEIVESCSPSPYIEMFSRLDRDGWVSWGENTNAGD